jgi:hypothetical protein
LRREVRDGGPGRIQGRGADALKFAECGHVGQILERSQKPCLRHERATPNRVVVGLGRWFLRFSFVRKEGGARNAARRSDASRSFSECYGTVECLQQYQTTENS